MHSEISDHPLIQELPKTAVCVRRPGLVLIAHDLKRLASWLTAFRTAHLRSNLKVATGPAIGKAAEAGNRHF